MQTIKANSQTICLYNTTGRVEDAGKNLETRLSGHAQGGFNRAQVSIQSKTVVHDQFFLTDDQGQEHAFQLQGFNVACRSGNRLSVLWAMRQGQKKGPYVAVYNHTTSSLHFDKKAMAALLRRPVLHLLGALVLLLLLGSQATFFYWLLPVAVAFWFLEGTISANRFGKEFDFVSLNAGPAGPVIGQGSPSVLPAG